MRIVGDKDYWPDSGLRAWMVITNPGGVMFEFAPSCGMNISTTDDVEHLPCARISVDLNDGIDLDVGKLEVGAAIQVFTQEKGEEPTLFFSGVLDFIQISRDKKAGTYNAEIQSRHSAGVLIDAQVKFSTSGPIERVLEQLGSQFGHKVEVEGLSGDIAITSDADSVYGLLRLIGVCVDASVIASQESADAVLVQHNPTRRKQLREEKHPVLTDEDILSFKASKGIPFDK